MTGEWPSWSHWFDQENRFCTRDTTVTITIAVTTSTVTTTTTIVSTTVTTTITTPHAHPNTPVSPLDIASLAVLGRAWVALAGYSASRLCFRQFLFGTSCLPKHAPRVADTDSTPGVTQREDTHGVKLNPWQLHAVDHAVGQSDGLVLLQGPPGTGKTTTIAAMLRVTGAWSCVCVCVCVLMCDRLRVCMNVCVCQRLHAKGEAVVVSAASNKVGGEGEECQRVRVCLSVRPYVCLPVCLY